MLNLDLYCNLIKDKSIIKYPINILNKYEFSADEINLLTKVGLPIKIEPFIWFLGIEDGGLEKLGDYYFNISNSEQQEVINNKKTILNNLIVIGKSAGNALCFNEKKQLVWIDYDDFYELFVNNSLEEFLECIVCYNDFVSTITNKYGNNVRYYNYIKEDDISNLEKQLNDICSGNLIESDFWISKLKFLEGHMRN